MKKSIIYITAIIALGLVSTAGYTQQATTAIPKVATKIATEEKAPEVNPAKPTVTGTQFTAEQPKPIVPGGEFKPMDTQKITQGERTTATGKTATAPKPPQASPAAQQQ